MTTNFRRFAFVALAALMLAALACTCSLGNLTQMGGGSGGAPNTFDGGDGFDTTGGGTLTVGGGSGSGQLNSLIEAHNWTFEGVSGQTVTINVYGQGGTDPRATLLDPRGSVLTQDDDGGNNYDSLIYYTLPETGTYTIRIDVYTTGPYTVSVR